ncbi:hypothetical protein ACFB49_46540 [Sphingomonas sp. DBB INV C78]|uniref:DUF2793 domain-containing protein n=1 Tax=Sphingomonas sp. DBB INV C78 TaxID=3349434 RepID=UPI0036D3A5F2
MGDTTPRFALPFILPGQAQKEMAHNEALARLDGALHPVAEALNVDSPPSSPGDGKAWIVGDSPTGDWIDHAGEIALWTEGGWRFVAPIAGMTIWLVPAATWVWHDGDVWRADPLPSFGVMVDGQQVVGEQAPAIALPSGGMTVDTEARAAIATIIATLGSHGLIAS